MLGQSEVLVTMIEVVIVIGVGVMVMKDVSTLIVMFIASPSSSSLLLQTGVGSISQSLRMNFCVSILPSYVLHVTL